LVQGPSKEPEFSFLDIFQYCDNALYYEKDSKRILDWSPLKGFSVTYIKEDCLKKITGTRISSDVE
jgi:hypothetical protein